MFESWKEWAVRNFKQVNKLEKYFQLDGKILSSTSCNQLYSNAIFSYFNNKYLFILKTHVKQEPKKQIVPWKHVSQCRLSKILERYIIIFSQGSDSKCNTAILNPCGKNFWFHKTLKVAFLEDTQYSPFKRELKGWNKKWQFFIFSRIFVQSLFSYIQIIITFKA